MTKLADLAYLKRRLIIAIGVLLFAIAGGGASAVFDAVKPFGFEDPDSEGSRAYDRYEELAGVRPTPGVVALVEPDAEIDSSNGRAAVQAVARELSAVPGVAQVRGPRAGDRSAISRDGDAAYVLGFLEPGTEDIADVGERTVAELGGQSGVTLGGFAVAAHQLNVQSEEDLRRVELFAAPILLLLCLWVFRSVVAALLPLLVGAFSITVALALMRALAEVIEIDVFSINIVTGLGLGLAIDYSLLIVARYREELERRGRGWAAIHRTLETAGRTVLFSAAIVAFALAALLVFPQRFLYSTGLGGAIVVLVSAAVSLTVLPAVLAALGERVNALGLQRAWSRSAGQDRGFWYALARFVMGRPIPIATAAATLMVAMSIPFIDVDLTASDARILPQSRSARQVDDALRERFSGYSTTPIIVVADSGDEAEATDLSAEVDGMPGVARVRGPRALDHGGSELTIIPSVDPLSGEAQHLLNRVRDLQWPQETLIGGRTAELVDQKESLESHLPLAVAIITVLTLVTLWVMTGSVVLPFVALVMNLLTITAAFGILVFIFQERRLESLLDYMSQGALDSSVPILLFAVVFGLSTDYGVFLLTRIKEAREEGACDSEAVAIGLERTGRTVTAAALLFAVAIGAFVFSNLVVIQQTAIGVSVAVLLDATIVRALLLPSLLQLLGERSWWAPRRLARLRGRFGVS